MSKIIFGVGTDRMMIGQGQSQGSSKKLETDHEKIALQILEGRMAGKFRKYEKKYRFYTEES